MFRVHIETDNAVFDGDAAPEVARILRAAADWLTTDVALSDRTERAPLRDVNGNGVGFAIFTPDHEEAKTKAHISVAGRALADQLSSDTFGSICPELASKLNRAVRRYRTVQEEFCNGDDPLSRENWEAWEHKWERKAERLEERIREIVGEMFPDDDPVSVRFRGDPRGYCVYLIHPAIPGNTWGGDEYGYGVGEGG